MFRSVILRFVLPVAFASCVVAYFGLPYIERLLAEWFRSDVELRAQLVMHSMEEPITDLVEKGNEARLRAYLAKITADERLLAILVCRPNGSTIFKIRAHARPAFRAKRPAARIPPPRTSCSCRPGRCRCRASISMARRPCRFVC